MAITVGIAGFTGKFAGRLISHLLAKPDIQLRGFCRNATKISPLLSNSPKIQITEGDAFDETAIRTFVKGCDVVVCCYLGDDRLMVEGQKLLIDLSEEANVARYIASDWSLDYNKLELGQLFPKDPMKHVKAYLDSKKSIKGVHVLIGAFIEPVFSPYFNIWDPISKTLQFWGTGDEEWEGTTYDNAAEYTAAAAVDRDSVGTIRVIGGKTTFRRLAESFEQVYGVKPQLKSLGTADDLFKRMHEMRTEDPAGFMKYMSMFYFYYVINGQTYVGPDYDNDKYPDVRPVTWEDFLRRYKLEDLQTVFFTLMQ